MTRSITESDLEIVAARHFRVLDTDGNGSLDKLEFVAGMGTLFKGSIEQQWKYAFDLFDADSDGFVTHQDLAEMFNATAQVQEKMLVELLKITRDQLRADGDEDVSKQFQIDIDMIEGSDGGSIGTVAVAELVAEILDEVDLDGDQESTSQNFVRQDIISEGWAQHSISFHSA